jgi:hypothetical protein
VVPGVGERTQRDRDRAGGGGRACSTRTQPACHCAAGSYLSCTEEIGWLCVGCDVVALHSPTTVGGSEAVAVPPCDDAVQLELVPRDAFRRSIYLQPLAILVTFSGAAVVHVTARMKLLSLSIELQPIPSTSTHAIITISGDAGQKQRRRAQLQCVSCTLAPAPFPGDAEDTSQLRFGAAAGARLDVRMLH